MEIDAKKGVQGATVSDLAWMSGSWKGLHGQDAVEEHWSAPAGGTLMGMFRWLKAEQVWFYELLVIEPEHELLVMRIKHFYPGLKGWEQQDESVRFVLVELEGQQAVFMQPDKPEAALLVYRREGPDRLVTYFERPGEEVKDDERFVFTRATI